MVTLLVAAPSTQWLCLMNSLHTPNHIPPRERLLNVGFSLLLFSYGSYGVWVNDLYVPARRKGLHLHDVPAWIMYGAIICACLVTLSVVADHYDRRNNETNYRLFAKLFRRVGFGLFVGSIAMALFR